MKVSRLVKELGEAREEYKRMLTELQSLEVVKAENNVSNFSLLPVTDIITILKNLNTADHVN